MTTTRIWYSPPGQTATARFDVPGSNVANVALTEVFSPAYAGGINSYHTRISNNYYRWRNENGSVDVAFANVSMINWTPSVGNTTLINYTFPNGGGTLSSTVSNISITGQWLVHREPVNDGSGADRQFTFKTVGNPGFGANGAAASTADLYQNYAGTPGYPRWNTGNTPFPWQNSAIQTYSITGNATTLSTPSANTFGGVRFYANVEDRVSYAAGATGSVEANVLIAFEYTYSRSYEVNLHSAAATLVENAGIGKISTQTGSYFEPGTETLVDYFEGDYAGSYVASEDIGGYVVDGYIADQVVTEFADGVLAGLAVVGTVSATEDTTAVASATQTYGGTITTTVETTVVAVGGQLLSVAAQDNTVETGFAVGDAVGIIQPAAATAEIETVWTDTEPSLLRGFSGSFEETAEAEFQATNRIGISDGIGYITTDYAEADYFAEGSGLTLFADTSLLEVDANVIRSDGTILFEGDFAATIQPGFQIDAGIITTGDAAFEISPYTTAGTGLLFAAAAELQQQADTIFIAGGLVVAAAQELILDSSVQATTTTAIFGTTAIDLLSLALASDSESRPSIKATIELLDGTGSLTATPFVDQSSRAALAIDNMQVQALAGYTLFGNTTNTIGINADFDSEGRIYYIDEYYTSQVAPESRLVAVPAESHSLVVNSETRVNTSLAENRGLVVEPETRISKPELLPTTLRGARLRRIPV